MYLSTLTSEEINEMPARRFEGRIVVVDDEESMQQAEKILQQEYILGYDTETRPSFQKGVKHGMALVQISTADTALLFRVKKIPLSEEICRILSDPGVIKVGAALRDDLRGMHQVAKFRPSGFVDLQSIVGQWGIQEMSVKKMAAIVLGIKISKAQRLTNWDAVRLTDSQQHYAATDAWVCREIYCRLAEGDPQRMEKILREQEHQQQARLEAEKVPKKRNYRTRYKHGKTDTEKG